VAELADARDSKSRVR